MSQDYFCVGASLSGLVNVESLVSLPPGIAEAQGGSPMPLSGEAAQRLLSGRLKRGGRANSAWVWGYFDNDMDDLLTLRRAIFGDLTTQSKQGYVITLDEHNEWSPFLCHIDAPRIGQTMRLYNSVPYDITFTLAGGVLQSVTKSSNFSLALSEHLVYVDTSGGNVTASLPALAGVTADVPYRLVRTSVSNSFTLDPNSSETIDSASTKSVSGANTSVTIIKSGSQWVTI